MSTSSASRCTRAPTLVSAALGQLNRRDEWGWEERVEGIEAAQSAKNADKCLERRALTSFRRRSVLSL